jgi:hypothetical protein
MCMCVSIIRRGRKTNEEEEEEVFTVTWHRRVDQIFYVTNISVWALAKRVRHGTEADNRTVACRGRGLHVPKVLGVLPGLPPAVCYAYPSEARISSIPARTKPDQFTIVTDSRIVYTCFSYCISANNSWGTYLTTLDWPKFYLQLVSWRRAE